MDQAIFWYRNEPLQPFAYKTAEQLVSDGRSDDLILLSDVPRGWCSRMILTGSIAAVYRMHTPKWAVSPMSGAGAASFGGRANRPGVPALYLALEVDTAVREYQQVSTLLPPGTLVSYEVTLAAWLIFSPVSRGELGRAVGRLSLRLAAVMV